MGLRCTAMTTRCTTVHPGKPDNAVPHNLSLSYIEHGLTRTFILTKRGSYLITVPVYILDVHVSTKVEAIT